MLCELMWRFWAALSVSSKSSDSSSSSSSRSVVVFVSAVDEVFVVDVNDERLLNVVFDETLWRLCGRACC